MQSNSLPKQRSKSHHYVPQFYIRRWADNSNRLFSFRQLQDRNLISRPSPRGVLKHDHIYTSFTRDGNDIYGEEAIFRQIDDDASKVLRILAEEELSPLSTESANKLRRFLVRLPARHPSLHNHFANTDSTMCLRLYEDLKSKEAVDNAMSIMENFRTSKDRAAMWTLMFARFGGVLSSVLFNNIPLVVKDLSKHGRLLASDYPFVSMPSIDALRHYTFFLSAPPEC